MTNKYLLSLAALILSLLFSFTIPFRTIFFKPSPPSRWEDGERMDIITKALDKIELGIERKISIIAPFDLLGTVSGKSALAFIRDLRTGEKRYFRPGDNLSDFRIVKIIPSRVTLERDGIIRELVIFPDKVIFMEPLEGTSLTAANVREVTISRQEMLAELPSVNELLKAVKVYAVPDSEPNTLKGFRVENIPSGSFIEKAGLQSGDIIRSVEGRELRSLEIAMKTFSELRNSPIVEISLLRQNQPITLRFLIKN